MSTNGNNIEKSFWQLISNIQNISKVEIPIIQRDYAQGREDEKTNKIRELFLDSLIKAIESEDSKLELDFVYGDIKNGVFQPLDGQQRLTTLWLLHWYIAFKAGTLKVNETTFKKFTYETRISSREFCNELVEKADNLGEGETLVEKITDASWFFLSWKKDPTIKSMLVMLDAIESKLNDKSPDKFKEEWDKLISDNPPITFHFKQLNDIGLTDDLYIKMNARGKQLTDFENFKADLVGYIKNENIEHENNIKESIAHKLDTTWTDIFWKNKSPNNKIDEIYFAFINRFLLNCLITYKEKKDKYLYTDKKLEDENKLFKYLYGDRGNDINVKYYGFDIYKTEKPVIKTGIIKLKTVLNRLETLKDKDNINKFFQPNWDENSGFCFIPEYKSNNNKEYIPTTLTQPQRVVFYAICCYFEKDNYDELNFKRWMRVVWNIVENANIESIPAMIGAMRLIDKLAEYSHDIYNHLNERDISNDFAKEQMEEEKEKAKKIVDDIEFNNNKGKTWEEKIIEAEEYAFFKGAIRFLLRDEEGKYNWDKFDARFEKAQKYFDKNGVKEEYKKDAILLRVLISYFNNIDQFKGQIFDNNATSWKSILINGNLIVPLNKFFEIDDTLSIDLKSFNSNITDKDKEQLRYFQNDLCKTPIITHFSEKSSLHWRYYGKYSVFPYNAKSQREIFVLADKRNEVLSDLEKKGIIEVDGWQKVNDLPFYKGREIYFTSKLNGKKYQWFDCLKEKQDNGNWQKIENITLDDLKEYLENQK
ncbi:MAG: hypothetical protein PWQ43_1537 [Rikenellaceae bacterium]|nr:hypothetical protein [Rikenellaceae bacterium]MDN5356593.1 hypothetical protein [Rikenellaceae bacterium]